MSPANVIIALENEALRAQVFQVLGDASERMRWERVDPLNWGLLLERVAACQPHSLLLDSAFTSGGLGPAIREVQSRSPQTRVIATHSQADSDSVLAAMRAGASEFVHPPFEDTLFAALNRIQDACEADSSQKSGKVIAFLSAKGGCGSTTLACHIATEMQKQTGGQVLLADFDFTSGVVGFLMKTASTYSVLDAVKNLSRLDASLWKALVAQPRPGFSVLPAPAAISHGEYPDEQDFKQVIRFMRTQHDWTIIDLGRSLTRTARVVLDEVDELFLVATLEVVALHGLKSIVRSVSNDETLTRKLHLILNRTPKMMDITLEELEKILGKPLYATLPNDYPGLYHSYAGGTLLPANNRLAEQFSRLALRISGKEEPKPARKRFALFG